MLRFTAIAANSQTPTDAMLVLPFDKRQKSRQRATTSSGEEIMIALPRGSVMRGGQVLTSEEGQYIQIEAAEEAVTTVVSDSAEHLARVAYHLGNRHISLQVGPGWVRYLQDPVLDKMVAGLGLSTVTELCAFEPESGAYSHSSHSHN